MFYRISFILSLSFPFFLYLSRYYYVSLSLSLCRSFSRLIIFLTYCLYFRVILAVSVCISIYSLVTYLDYVLIPASPANEKIDNVLTNLVHYLFPPDFIEIMSLSLPFPMPLFFTPNLRFIFLTYFSSHFRCFFLYLYL